MGKRGPLPKKQALRIQSGQLPFSAEGVKDLQEQFKPPRAPKHFGKEERAIWRVTVDLLACTKVLEKIDQAILGAYCDAYVKWQKVERQLQIIEKERGVAAHFLTTGANGNLVTHPLITISRKAQSDMVGYAAQLGMTPAARLRIQVVPAKPGSNAFEELKDQRDE